MGFIKSIKAMIRYFRKDNLYLETFCIGFNSFISIENDDHIVMLDYDKINFDDLIKDVEELIYFFELSNADIFKTNQGYHVFFWYDFVPYSRLRMIIDYSRCDPMYKYISKYYNYKTIRAGGKYKTLDTEYLRTLKGNYYPDNEHLELGNLKKREYLSLRGMHKIIDKKVLKENENSNHSRIIR